MPTHALVSPVRLPWRRLLLALAPALCLWAGGSLPVAAQERVNFPAAAGVARDTRPVGPMRIGPVTNATLLSNDIILLDPGYTGGTTGAQGTTGGAIINLTVRNNGTAGETILASSTVGSGVTYAQGTTGNFIAVSPAGTIYYYNNNGNNNSTKGFIALNPSTLARTVVSDVNNLGLGPVPVNIQCLTWDLATNTILYFDFVGTGSTSNGFYRLDPATGVRTAVSLNSNSPGSGGVALVIPTFMTTDAFGNLFYLDKATSNTQFPQIVLQLPVNLAGSAAATNYGARRIVSSNTVGTQTDGTYQELFGLAVDNSQTVPISNGLPTYDLLIVTDSGDDTASSDLFRIPTNTGNHARIIANSSNTGGTIFDYPLSAVIDTTGRVYYEDQSTSVGVINVIPAGTRTNTPLSGARNLSNALPDIVAVPPPQPTLATGTVTNKLGTTATLNGNVTADGGVTNSGIIARGFVFAPTSTNSAPKIGGTGVTQIVNFVATSLPVAQGSNTGSYTANLTGLTQNTSYTFSAYAQNVSGFNYSAPVTFVTATSPSVTTNTATNITGSSAALNGNVTADGGASLTSRGFVYSSSNTMPVIGGTGVTNLPDASATTGSYSDPAGGLSQGTTYYYRAYATNSVGTTYGSVLNFKTIAAPTANSQSVNVAHNTATAFTLTGSDPNNPTQTLTYSISSFPTHGTLSGTAPNLTYTPTTGYNGTDSLTFTVTNTSGLTSNPAAVTFTVDKGTPVANGQSVSIGFNTATSITLTGSDDDNPALTLTYTVLTAPTHGTLSGTAPNLTYTPTANYQGADSFTFRASNGTSTSNTATVSITVAAGTPTANTQGVNVNLNLPKTITLAGSDPDSPALSLTYTVVTLPTNGTLSGTAPNLTYTPNTNYTGSDSFTFTVSNGQKTSAPATVSLTVVGQPTISSFTPTSGPAGTLVTITGTNLQNASGVNFFRNVAGTSFTVVSSTQVTVRVPAGVTTGTLTLLSGSGSNSSSTKFIVTP